MRRFENISYSPHYNPAVSTAAQQHSSTASVTPATSHNASLPEGWQQAVDRQSQRVYYSRTGSNHTQWERPRPLLPGWTEAVHPQTQQLYYYHTQTRQTTVERPESQPPTASTSNHPGYTTGPFAGPSITPPSQTPEPPVEALAGQVASLQIRSRSPSGFERAIRARLLNSARTKADMLLGRTQPVPGGPRDEILATAAQQTPAPVRDLSNTFIELHDTGEGQEGTPDSISSWIALGPYSDLSSHCEELSSKMAFSIVKQAIDQAPLEKQLQLCQVLVNDVKKQILADSHRRAATPWDSEPTTHGKTIRSAMEIVSEKNDDADMDDFRFSDMMQQLENFRREHSIDYSRSWGDEDV